MKVSLFGKRYQSFSQSSRLFRLGSGCLDFRVLEERDNQTPQQRFSLIGIPAKLPAGNPMTHLPFLSLSEAR